MKSYSLGYSPCPNDTFIFFALVHHKIKSRGMNFREVLRDVEELNRMAFNAELDVTKASFHAYGHLRDRYFLLRAGGALGKGCGPLLVARHDMDVQDLKGKTVAVPGIYTTAFFLLQIAVPSLSGNIASMPFHRIIESVREGHADAGLIIHESRFTYEEAGLKKILDLGEWWEDETGLPVPLGGILARRSMGVETVSAIDSLLKESILYAFSNREEPSQYIKSHSQEMSDDVIRRHIDLYVNNYSLDIGEEGARAVEEMFRRAEERRLIGKSSVPLFAVQPGQG